MNILLVTDSYPPEIRSASHLMLELAETLTKYKHDVTVITTYPEYNLDTETEIRKYEEKEVENGVTVLRLNCLPHHNVPYIIRGLSQILMPFQFLRVINKYETDFDVVLIYSPPLPLSMLGKWLKTKSRQIILNIQDLFPQNAIDLGILNNRILIKFFQWLESSAYQNADTITAHSSGNVNKIIEQHPSVKNKLHVLHNWVDIAHHETQREFNFREKWNITEEYVVIFAGVLGPSQNLEIVLKVAEEFMTEDILFLIVGDGSEKEKLTLMAERQNLTNVRFKSFVSRKSYPDLLSICDIGIVCLSPKNKTPVVPGKIMGYMAAGIPVVAFLQSVSDGHKIIQEAKCGTTAVSSNVSDCIMAFKTMIQEKENLNKLGQSGKEYAIKHFSKEVCIKRLLELIEEFQNDLKC